MRHVRTVPVPMLRRMAVRAIALVVFVWAPAWPALSGLGDGTAHTSFARVPSVAQDAEAKSHEKKTKKDKKGDEPEHRGPGAPADRATIGSNLSSEEMQRLLSLHNKVRADVGVEPLTWSAELAAYAQTWADHLASTGALAHRPHDGEWKQLYGENLFGGAKGLYGVADAVKTWEKEKTLYSGQAIAIPSPSFLHYTQLVWRASTQIGCGKAEHNGNVLIVCNYAPGGNIPGQKPY